MVKRAKVGTYSLVTADVLLIRFDFASKIKMYYHRKTFAFLLILVLSSFVSLNPFVPNGPFLYLLKT